MQRRPSASGNVAASCGWSQRQNGSERPITFSHRRLWLSCRPDEQPAGERRALERRADAVLVETVADLVHAAEEGFEVGPRRSASSRRTSVVANEEQNGWTVLSRRNDFGSKPKAVITVSDELPLAVLAGTDRRAGRLPRPTAAISGTSSP